MISEYLIAYIFNTFKKKHEPMLLLMSRSVANPFHIYTEQINCIKIFF